MDRLKIIRVLMKEYRNRSFFVFFALVAADVTESIGLLGILPLLEFIVPSNEGASKTAQKFAEVFNYFHIHPTVTSTLVFIGVFMLMKSAFIFFAMKRVGYVIADLTMELQMELLNAVAEAKWSFFLKQPTGKFINAVSVETTKAGTAYLSTIKLIASIAQVICYMAVAAFVSVRITLVAILVGAVMGFGLNRFVDLAYTSGRQKTAVLKALASRFADVLQGMKIIKAMGFEPQINPLLHEDNEKLNIANRQSVLAKYGVSTLREPIIVTFMLVGMYYCVVFENIQVPTLITLVALFYRAVNSVGSVQESYQSVGDSEHNYWSVRGLIDEAIREKEPKEATENLLPLPEKIRSIHVNNASFSHGAKQIFSDASLELERGTVTALVGHSGCGKTTLSDCLCKLYSPSSGEISVDGINLKNVSTHEWRRRIGYVQQETFLFHGSVLKNITMGDPAISSEKVKQVLEQVGAAKFISELPLGLETPVGERGHSLSGGQRQRIALARALVRDPQLLILDEATTGLDPQTELSILMTLKKLSSEMIVITISHQASIVAIADKVYEVGEGKIKQVLDLNSAQWKQHSQNVVQESRLI